MYAEGAVGTRVFMLCDFHERTRVLQCLAVCMICMQKKKKKKKVKMKERETQEKKKREKRIEVLSTVNDAVRYPHRKRGGEEKKGGESRRFEIVLPSRFFIFIKIFILLCRALEIKRKPAQR